MKRLSNGHLLHPISEVILSHVEVPLKGPFFAELLAVSHGSEEIVSSAILEHIVCDCHSAIYFYPQESLYQTCVDSNFLFLTNNLLQNHLNHQATWRVGLASDSTELVEGRFATCKTVNELVCFVSNRKNIQCGHCYLIFLQIQYICVQRFFYTPSLP